LRTSNACRFSKALTIGSLDTVEVGFKHLAELPALTEAL